ncbi:hypothetical protein BV22DRAFT_990801, partial [Leucogyrophana mollusca]
WITNFDKYFHEQQFGGKKWRLLVNLWVRLKELLQYPDGSVSTYHPNWISSSGHPKEIGLWIKCSHPLRLQLCKVADTLLYVKAWHTWWRTMQPTWRKTDTNPDSPLRQLDNQEFGGWSDICRGGKNGFFMVILSLVLW